MTDGKPEQLGHLDRRRPGVAVGGLGGRDDEVGLGALDGLGEHLGRRQGVGALEGVVAHEDGLGRAHGEGGAQPRGLAPGGHRDQGDLAAARRLGELEAHLDAIGVGVVHDQLSLPDQGVGLGSRASGAAGSGICFTQTTTFMASIVPENLPSTNPRAWPSAWRPRRAGGRALSSAQVGEGGGHRIGDHDVHAGIDDGVDLVGAVHGPGDDGQTEPVRPVHELGAHLRVMRMEGHAPELGGRLQRAEGVEGGMHEEPERHPACRADRRRPGYRARTTTP